MLSFRLENPYLYVVENSVSDLPYIFPFIKATNGWSTPDNSSVDRGTPTGISLSVNSTFLVVLKDLTLVPSQNRVPTKVFLGSISLKKIDP